jgi:uncharacterized protein
MISQADINNWFSYHAPVPEQLAAYNDIRQAAKIYAETVNKHVPDSADKTAAVRKIRESVMAANLAVACNWPAVEVVGTAIPPHQQRVFEEKKELDEKSGKLNTFFNTAIFDKLSSEEQDRLHRQYEFMVRYSAVLNERIAAF